MSIENEISGNHYDKYRTKNPIERRLMSGFMGALEELVVATDSSEVHEVGCGEGELTRMLGALGLEARGSDLSQTAIDEAIARSVSMGYDPNFKVSSVYDLKTGDDSAELVVCCEVLEHLEDPALALETLASVSGRSLIVSVPREPIWRAMNVARLAYLNDLGNTPGHINHWSKRSFISFLEERVDVVDVRSPLPWTMALCKPRS